MKLIYNSIKNDIRKHPDVISSILGFVPDWKRSQFIILADLISDHLSKSEILTASRKLELGNTISAITLQRFFENEYQIKTHNDLRFIKTLDKLCIFLGKTDLNDYVSYNYQRENEIKSVEILKTPFSEKELVIKFCDSQFEGFRDLPRMQLPKMCEFVFKDSPLSARIRIFIEKYEKKNLKFVTENNRSNYEIFEIKKISDEPDLKVIQTKEFWNLLFENELDQNYVINHLNTQFYFIKKIDNEWKIWDNYNPDYGKILKIN